MRTRMRGGSLVEALLYPDIERMRVLSENSKQKRIDRNNDLPIRGLFHLKFYLFLRSRIRNGNVQ